MLLLSLGMASAQEMMMDKMEYMPPDDTCNELPMDVMVSSDVEGVQCQIVTGQNIGIKALEMYTGVDVWGVEMVNAEVCFAGSGSLTFLDATYIPRKQMDVDYMMKDGMTCANIMHRGTVVLMPDMMAMDDMDSMDKMDDMMMDDMDSMGKMDDMDSMGKMDDMDSMGMMDDMDSMDKMDDMSMKYAMMKDSMDDMVMLMGCEITAEYSLNVRDAPGGKLIDVLPGAAMKAASARTMNWFKIEHKDAEGWVTSHYALTEGDCG
ncbi:MAG: SH3 domain-containing protein [Chloroflexi bacterium]|nr:SH3 domain-containing protein [Chloroflexota bacterium]